MISPNLKSSEPFILMMTVIIFSIVRIGLLWAGPRKYKIIGTVCAIIGVIISIVNLSQFYEITIPEKVNSET